MKHNRCLSHLKRFWRVPVFLLAALLCQTAFAQTDPQRCTITHEKGVFRLFANNFPIDEVLYQIEESLGVRITGLQPQPAAILTLELESPSKEQLIKRLLQHIGENNVAFLYNDHQLTAARILPHGTGQQAPRITPPPAQPPPAPKPQAAEADNQPEETGETEDTVVLVNSVVAGSQAAEAGIAPGDIIASYDGVALAKASELAKLVRETDKNNEVDLVVLTESGPVTLRVTGGILGVRVRTESANPEEPAP